MCLVGVWDADFNRTLAEYDGVLKVRTCNYCGRDLLSDEPAKIHSEYGRVCTDCVDVIKEESKIWGR